MIKRELVALLVAFLFFMDMSLLCLPHGAIVWSVIVVLTGHTHKYHAFFNNKKSM